MTSRFCGKCKVKHSFCESCGIGIGSKHRETSSKMVGDYVLCWSCYQELNEKGRVEIDRHGEGSYPVIKWLREDGSLVKEKKAKLVV